MPGRKYSATDSYRYGFNGKENDNEVKGEGNQQDYGMRIYDPRLGRFLSVDPLAVQYAELTPYQFAGNTPILAVDIDGLESDKNVDPTKQHSLTNDQLLGAIKIGYDVINEDVKNKKFSPSKDKSKELLSAIEAYWDKHQDEFNLQTFTDFKYQVEEHFKGLKEVAFTSKLGWDHLGSILDDPNPDHLAKDKISQVQVNLKIYNGTGGSIVASGTQAAGVVVSASATQITSPKSSKDAFKSNTQKQIVEAGKQTALVPQKALDVVNYAKVNNGAAMQGYKGGRTFLNDGRNDGQILPKIDANSKPITYREYDVNPFQAGVNRGAERVVIGSNGNAYYTTNHYKTFIPIKN